MSTGKNMDAEACLARKENVGGPFKMRWHAVA